ncbi:MAG: ABC transporter substrate-binding protein [Deltaproteobacteria bacterium]|nr:ABC transporter substrate-binding protein [Deltaproteobacteria bacterium]
MRRSLAALLPALGMLLAAGPARAADNIVLGVPTALGTIEGQDSLRAAQLAVKEINEQGGVQVGAVKRKLEIVSIDTREAEAGVPVTDALAAMEKLITEKKPAAIVVGAFRSEVLVSAMDMIARVKIPYLCTIGMSPVFDDKVGAEYEKYKYNFRLSLSARYLVGNLGKTMSFLKTKYGFDKVYFLHQDVAWAKGTIGGLTKVMEGAGWKVLGSDPYPTGSRDFSASLTKAKAGGAQVVVPMFDMPESGVLVKQARSMKVPALVAGFISPAAPGTAWATFKGDIDGLVNFLFEPGAIPLPSARSRHFTEAYGKAYGEELKNRISGHGPGPSYDAVYVLAGAITRAGSLDADALVKEIEKTDMEGAVGRLIFTKTHSVPYGDDPKAGGASIAFQWRQGKRVVVFPEAIAEGNIELHAR